MFDRWKLHLFFEDVSNIQYRSSLFFQKIEDYEGKGWIHQDENIFTFIIYLHQPNPKINCGTSIWSLDSDFAHSVNSPEESQNIERLNHFKTRKLNSSYQEKHHKKFNQEISIPDKYNRFMAFSASQFHSVNNLNPIINPRFILIGFVQEIGKTNLPILRAGQTAMDIS